MTSRVALPGLRSPSAGFDQPFEMLGACHERVQRTLDLLQRLQTYLAEQGVDDSARQAARDVLRYFDIAAPLHHQDEERHVFPPLLAQGDAATVARRVGYESPSQFSREYSRLFGEPPQRDIQRMRQGLS